MIKAVLILGLAVLATAQYNQNQNYRSGGQSYKPVSTQYAQPTASFRPVAPQAPRQPAVAPYKPAAYKPVASYQAAPVQSVPVQSAPVSSGYSAAKYSEQEQQYAPAPYTFSFDTEDEQGTKLGRQESSNEQGVVTGSYTITDASGIARIVNYVADAEGFRATVQTNEPGTQTSNPANVEIHSSYVAPAAPAGASAPRY